MSSHLSRSSIYFNRFSFQCTSLAFFLNKRHIDWKGSKTIFADDIILYVENSKESIKKLLQWVSSTKLQDTRTIYKNQLYSIHEQWTSENEINKNNSNYNSISLDWCWATGHSTVMLIIIAFYKKNKIRRYQFNKTNERQHWKLQNIILEKNVYSAATG